jgi:hypothetical protein
MTFHIYVKNGYVGSTVATLGEIKSAFPYSEVTGSRVDVWAMSSPRQAMRAWANREVHCD